MPKLFLARWLAALCAALALLGAGAALAKEAESAAADPALEKRVMDIAAELRCLVCQNQTIADSHADLAVDLRREIRGMLQQGKSDREVLDFMTQRYGDFVLYRPPFKSSTALLWLGPALLLVLGVTVLLLVLRRRQRLGDEAFEPSVPAEEEAPLSSGAQR
jgi:cytochrome c-type biogenesis protein CcmH